MRVQFILLLCLAPIAGLAAPMSKAGLGKKLFFDRRLSADQSVSCASCHRPEKAFTNGKKTAIGAFHKAGDRNVPTLLNRAGTSAQFWDMRARSLEEQAEAVLKNPGEMGNDIAGAIRRLNADREMKEAFHAVFGEGPSLKNIAGALAAYERTLLSPPAPYDRFLAGDLQALGPSAQRGHGLFFGKFKCASCHQGVNFTDEKLNVRCYPFVADLDTVPGPRFKTPTLRNLTFTAPYMHNGSLATLEAAVDFYNPSVRLDARGKPVKNGGAMVVTAQDKKDLVAFLRSLSAEEPFIEKE